MGVVRGKNSHLSSDYERGLASEISKGKISKFLEDKKC